MTESDNLIVQPGKALRGTTNVPGDKSVSHRAVMFGALAQGETHVRGWLAAEYRAALFELNSEPVAHALFRPAEGGIYLRQFYVARGCRPHPRAKRESRMTNKRLQLAARLPGAPRGLQALGRPGGGAVIAGRPAGSGMVGSRAGGS